jgi:N-dimethylarginine dimethylaminohydrolase
MPLDAQPGTAHRYLMCPPRYFDVSYSINPWMDPSKPVDAGLAMAQWERLRATYLSLGHEVEIIDPLPGLPDMVFAANGASVVNDQVLVSRYRYPQRTAEEAAFRNWFISNGYQVVVEPEHINEGQGDYLFEGNRLLAGTGFRTDRLSHAQAQELFGWPVLSLTLVDPRYYHLDTALAVLRPGEIMYLPEAFSLGSQRILRRLYPDALIADPIDAEGFGLNAVSDGHHVVLPEVATGLIDKLRDRGYEPIGLDMSELHKSGGAVKCCTLELRTGLESRADAA